LSSPAGYAGPRRSSSTLPDDAGSWQSSSSPRGGAPCARPSHSQPTTEEHGSAANLDAESVSICAGSSIPTTGGDDNL
jgi:hypothetical protein